MTAATDGLEVRGGAHGLAVSLDELESGAAILHSIGLDLAEVAVGVGATAPDPRLAAAGTVAPVEYVRAEAAIMRCAGVTGAAGLAADVGATALATRAAVTSYRHGERAVEGLFDGLATSMGVGIGMALPGIAVEATALGYAIVSNPMHPPGLRDAIIAAGLGQGRQVDEILLDHPWIVPAAADGLDGLIIGLGAGTPALGTWMSWRAGRYGVPYPPRNREDALGVILAATKGAALDESGKDVRVRAHRQRTQPAPRTLTDLVAADGPVSGKDRVRVTGIPQADGSWTWVVDIPGTQTFTPQAGENPWDLTSNVALSAGQQTLTTKAVSRALADAQRRTGATGRGKVLLGGHSQGGITAAALAADPTFRRRYGVTHVVTSGAPIATLDVPEDVSVLSLEHHEDLVPALDGQDNPDRAQWVTVRREVSEELGPDGRATQAHDNGRYAETARRVDASDDPSVAAWRAGASPFLDSEGGPAVVIDYDIERVDR